MRAWNLSIWSRAFCLDEFHCNFSKNDDWNSQSSRFLVRLSSRTFHLFKFEERKHWTAEQNRYRSTTGGYSDRPGKCTFDRDIVQLLGHIFLANEISVDTGEVKVVLQEPLAQKNWTKKFPWDCISILKVQKRICKTSSTLACSKMHPKQISCGSMKSVLLLKIWKRLCQKPRSNLPGFPKAFIVATDASSLAVGLNIAQKNDDGKVHPI